MDASYLTMKFTVKFTVDQLNKCARHKPKYARHKASVIWMDTKANGAIWTT